MNRLSQQPRLPYDLLGMVARYLPVKEAALLTRTCRRLRNELIWKKLREQHFPGPSTIWQRRLERLWPSLNCCHDQIFTAQIFVWRKPNVKHTWSHILDRASFPSCDYTSHLDFGRRDVRDETNIPSTGISASTLINDQSRRLYNQLLFYRRAVRLLKMRETAVDCQDFHVYHLSHAERIQFDQMMRLMKSTEAQFARQSGRFQLLRVLMAIAMTIGLAIFGLNQGPKNKGL